jgi:hypothetical protein
MAEEASNEQSISPGDHPDRSSELYYYVYLDRIGEGLSLLRAIEPQSTIRTGRQAVLGAVG